MAPKPVHRDPWNQQAGESASQYAMFKAYCDAGHAGTYQDVANRFGCALSRVESVAVKNNWDSRVSAYCIELNNISTITVADGERALQMQYKIGEALLGLGINALQLKNPSMIRMKEIHKLIETGGEMMRKGAGLADMKVDIETVDRVKDAVADFIIEHGDD